MLTSNSVLYHIPDWGRRRVHLHSRAEPPQSATGPAANPTGSPRHCSPAHSRFCCSRFDTHAYVIHPVCDPRLSMLTSLFTDGLSIPFFSAGRHTLTISRSAVAADPPDWLLWARRAPPQMNPDCSPTSEGADDAVVSREGPRREGRKRVEWPDELGQTEQDDAKTPSTPSTVTKINEVLLCRLSVMHAIFLTHIFSSSRKDPPASLSGPSP